MNVRPRPGGGRVHALPSPVPVGEGLLGERVDGRRRSGAVGLTVLGRLAGRQAGHATVQAKLGRGEGLLPKMHLVHCVVVLCKCTNTIQLAFQSKSS